jgi:hypothetical protein
MKIASIHDYIIHNDPERKKKNTSEKSAVDGYAKSTSLLLHPWHIVCLLRTYKNGSLLLRPEEISLYKE